MMLTDLPRYMVGGYVDYCNRYNCVTFGRRAPPHLPWRRHTDLALDDSLVPPVRVHKYGYIYIYIYVGYIDLFNKNI